MVTVEFREELRNAAEEPSMLEKVEVCRVGDLPMLGTSANGHLGKVGLWGVQARENSWVLD